MKNIFLRFLWSVLFSAAMLVAGHEVEGSNLGRIISTQTRLVRHQATEYQRKVAEARARAWVADQRRREAYEAEQRRKAAAQAKSTTKAKKSGKKKTSSSKRSTAKPQKLPRYIAVDTVKDERSSPKTEKAVMLFDTYAEKLVGNNVYDLENPPAVDTPARFETYSALYVGVGGSR